MPLLTVSIEPAGLVVPVMVSVSQPRLGLLKSAGLPIPEAVSVRALIDTGASCTAIDPSVLRQLGLPPTGTVSIVTPSTGTTPHTCNQFDVGLAFVMPPNGIHVATVTLPVVEASLDSHGIQALIGRDVLSKGLLVYNGPNNSLSLAF